MNYCTSQALKLLKHEGILPFSSQKWVINWTKSQDSKTKHQTKSSISKKCFSFFSPTKSWVFLPTAWSNTPGPQRPCRSSVRTSGPWSRWRCWRAASARCCCWTRQLGPLATKEIKKPMDKINKEIKEIKEIKGFWYVTNHKDDDVQWKKVLGDVEVHE